METKEQFERDGTIYIALVPGTEYKKDNKTNCIMPKGAKRPISIKTALKNGLIATQTTGDLFDPLNTAPTPEEKTYYMPVDKLRAEVFLAHGLIYPAVYDKAGFASNFGDLQSSTPGELTLFSAPTALSHGHLQLRLLLLSTEIAKANVFEGGIRLSVPLPISRIVEIQVGSHVTDIEHFLAGWVKPDVPVPKHLFISSQVDGSYPSHSRTATDTKAKRSDTIADAIRNFDQQMGALAFLRNAGRYLSEKTGEYADYPASYFALAERVMNTSFTLHGNAKPPTLSLQLFDSKSHVQPEEQCVLSLIKKSPSYIDKDTAHDCAKKLYYSTGEKKELGQALNTLFKKGDYRSAILELQNRNVPELATILAALYKFSNRNGDDRRSVKQKLHEDWTSPERMEAALYALGAYYGYTALDAKETRLYSVHRLIRPLIGGDAPPIKFDLTTCFDRRLIEAVYQRCFCDTSVFKKAMALYDSKLIQTMDNIPHQRSIQVKDDSYLVQDLQVRKYTVTRLGRFIDKLRTWPSGSVNENSETGKYLMSSCLRHADQWSLENENGKVIPRYRISLDKLIDLLTNDSIKVNLCVLEVALAEDIGRVSRQ